MAPPIAISGAGPSGLTLGRLLGLANIPYIIFERDISAASTVTAGGTLDIHADSGQLALQEAGLIDQFKTLARGDAPFALANSKGKVHAVFGEDGKAEKPEIDRKDLRASLLNSVPAERVRWGSRVRQVQRDTDGSMSVHFTNGGVESGFSLVVGADGAWSRARSSVTSAKPQYSGTYYLATSIKPDNPYFSSVVSLAGQGNYMALGDRKMVIAMKLGAGSYYIAVGSPLPEKWSTENAAISEDSAALRESSSHDHFADWPLVHTDLIRNSDGGFYAWPLYSMPSESSSWKTIPGIASIGDAAHLTTPFSGEGVNSAMYDSLQLAQQIIKHGLDDLSGAVSEYEQSMFPRARDLIEKSAKSGKLMLAPDAPRGWLKAFAGMDISE